MDLKKMQPGDVVYGPFPTTITNRMKISHYCLVLSVDEDKGLFLAALGTSSHIDSSPLEYELLIDNSEDLRRAKLKRPTRFNLGKTEWLPSDKFCENSNIRFSPKLVYALFRACKAAGLFNQEEYDQ